MGKFIVIAAMLSLSFSAMAGGGHGCTKKVVENANPQHAGFPKANQKGDMPFRIDTHRYVLTNCSK